jgi:ADP-ribose pyrophosphatase
VHQRLWEVPAGLRDVEGEDMLLTARRELAEETDYTAARFDLLVDLQTSPGFSTETIRMFLARDLTPVPEQERHERADEEADLEIAWFDLDEAVAMILRGEITNSSTVAGLLAAARAREDGWATLRPADTPAA